MPCATARSRSGPNPRRSRGLGPKLRWGPQVSKLCFAHDATEAELPKRAFPTGAYGLGPKLCLGPQAAKFCFVRDAAAGANLKHSRLRFFFGDVSRSSRTPSACG